LRTSRLDIVPDKEAAPGSPEYLSYWEGLAEQFRNRLDSDVEVLRSALSKLERSEAWKIRGAMSWEFYCAERFRLDGADLAAIRSAKPGESLRSTLRTAAIAKAAQPLAKHGGARAQPDLPDGKQGSNTTLNGRGADYLAARIKRDHPAIAADMEAGKFRSVRAAAKAAGIVRELSNLEKAMRALARLDEAELRAVAAEAKRLAEAKAGAA